MRLQKALLLLLTLFGFLTVSAQDDDPPIKVDSSVVRLNVGVVDRQGKPITNLNRENFLLYENGVKQEILRFEPTVTPFSVVMILDMSGSTTSFRQVIQQSAFRFVDALSPDDRVAVIEFYDKVNVRNDFTNNRKVIASSIMLANGTGKTQLYKALDVALDKLSKEKSRRKAIIVLTDGIDSAVQNSDRSFLEKFKESDIPNAIKPETSDALTRVLSRSDAQGVTIYPMALPTGDPIKLADPTPTQFAMFNAARARLRILAERTGGTLNVINRLEEMGKIYGAVAAEIRTLYTIEYQSTNSERDGKWRAIKVEVNNSELTSKTRTGYFAK
ncbi:MAG TPA: VWA domain-containing protein [Pyrinomonadaceae bacterium]|jgi:VWFA-related protein